MAGSDRSFKHSTKPKVVTVAGKSGDDVPTGTLKTIMKDSGLEKK
jgi:predicted RNA binding protein YcfA (HicA-like mRNA interferase family)